MSFRVNSELITELGSLWAIANNILNKNCEMPGLKETVMKVLSLEIADPDKVSPRC
jgi:hypothetical protein